MQQLRTWDREDRTNISMVEFSKQGMGRSVTYKATFSFSISSPYKIILRWNVRKYSMTMPHFQQRKMMKLNAIYRWTCSSWPKHKLTFCFHAWFCMEETGVSQRTGETPCDPWAGEAVDKTKMSLLSWQFEFQLPSLKIMLVQPKHYKINLLRITEHLQHNWEKKNNSGDNIARMRLIEMMLLN